MQFTDLAGKRLELLREVVSGLDRLAIMANGASLSAVLEMREAETTARTLGLEVTLSEIRRAEDIAPAFEAFKSRVDALYVASEVKGQAVFAPHQHRIRFRFHDPDPFSVGRQADW